LLDLLGVDESQRDFAALGAGSCLGVGKALPVPSPVFPRYLEKDAENTKQAGSKP
jgi:methionyl-tRNA synthetase